MHFSILDGILKNKLFIYSSEMPSQATRIASTNSYLVLYYLTSIDRFIIDHKFSIGERSHDRFGQSITSIPDRSIALSVAYALCIGALSYWKMSKCLITH